MFTLKKHLWIGILIFCLLLGLHPAPTLAHPNLSPEQIFISLTTSFVDVLRMGQFLPPPAIARGVAIVQTCAYDTWSIFDSKAIPSLPALDKMNLRWQSHVDEAIIVQAIGVAMHRCSMFILESRPQSEIEALNVSFTALGVDITTGTSNFDQSTIIGRANIIAEMIIEFRKYDGANQHADAAGTPIGGKPYSDFSNYVSVNYPQQQYLKTNCTSLRSVNHWQPLQDSHVSGPQKFVLPHWSCTKPFALTSASQFRPAGPPFMYSNRQSECELATLEVIAQSGSLDDRKKMIAEFWGPLDPTFINPPIQWFLIAMDAARHAPLNLERSVKLLFILSNGLFDAGITAWESKRFFDHVRPITSVNCVFESTEITAWKGPFLGTGAIYGRDWRSYLPTPPFPDYISGHATFSGAASTILASFFDSDSFIGPNEFVFPPGSSRIEPKIDDPSNPKFVSGLTNVPAASGTGPGYSPAQEVTLRYATWSEAAADAALSRLLGGIHISQSNADGLKAGQAVGRNTFKHTQRLFAGTRKRRCYTL